jgi:hypothetical protein
MNRTAQYLLAIVLVGAAMTPSLTAGAASNGGRPKRSRDTTADRDRSADAREEEWEHDPVVFSARERDAIRNYYRGATSNLSPGLAQRNGNRPPGLRKHLQRNGMLPPGLQQRMEPLSGDLERRLQPLYSGYARGMIGQDVVIIENHSQRIMDVIRDVTTVH